MYKISPISDHYSPKRMEFDKLVDKLNEDEFKIVTEYIENLLLAGIKMATEKAPTLMRAAGQIGDKWRK
jgi:hypothetical protein